MVNAINEIGKKLGILRGSLSLLAIILILLTPFSDPTLAPYGMGMLRAVVIPVAGPIVFMVLMLDLMMSMIFRHEYQIGSMQRSRLVFISKWNLVVGLLLLFVWLPIFLRATAY